MSDSTRLRAALSEVGFRGRLEADAALAPHTTWRIGGPAELLATPADPVDLALALGWAWRTGTPWRILGNGSNLLVREAGVDGLVLRLRRCLDSVAIADGRLTGGAGAMLPAVARQAARRGLEGLEFGAGIPGTLGGAVLMNAGWHEHEIGNVVESVDLLAEDGERQRVDRAACAFRYRGSRFRGGREVIVGCTLALGAGEAEAIEARLDAFAESRKRNQPTEHPSCGSVFLKPPGDFAGRLIDAAGLKGLRIGDAEVSSLHANFFINRGQATADQMLELVEQAERTVLDRFGVELVREFELW